MSLEKILSISGKPGLYQLISQTRSGFLAQSLLDGKKVSVSAHNNVSLLSDIAVYTLKEEVPLRKVFLKIQEKENGGQAISHKEDKEKLEEYFFSILPDYDEDKVYASDIKKIIQWYNVLQDKKMDDFSEPKEDEKTQTAIKENLKKAAKTVAPKNTAAKASSVKKGGAAKNTVARKAQ